MNHRRNALADIFAGISPEKIDQLQRFVNTDSGFEEESSSDLIVDATTKPTDTSAPLNRSIPIDIYRNASLDAIFYDQITTNYSVFRDFESSNEDNVSDDEEDNRFVEFVNSPRYLQRRLGIAEPTFRENLNMLTGILASH